MTTVCCRHCLRDRRCCGNTVCTRQTGCCDIMDFELMNLATGKIFHKTVLPVAKALGFLHRTQYSRKILVLNYRYHQASEEALS